MNRRTFKALLTPLERVEVAFSVAGTNGLLAGAPTPYTRGRSHAVHCSGIISYPSGEQGGCCMIVPRFALLVAALLLTATVDLFAQQEAPVAPGDRVRVAAPTEVSGRFVGTVMEIGADTCVLAVEGRAEPLALPLASVTKFEVVRGQQSWGWWKGALIGLFGGAALGGGIALPRPTPTTSFTDSLL